MEILQKKICKKREKSIIAVVNTIEDEQDTGIAYYFGQEMSEKRHQ